MIAQVRRKTRGDRLRDFDGGKLDSVLSERLPGERRSRHDAGLAAVEHPPDLAVAPHAIGKTGPAGALARAEHRPHQGKNAGGLDQQPGRAVRQMLPVQFSQACVEIIAHQRDGQIGRALARRERRAGSARRQIPLHPARRSIECGRGRSGDFSARPAATGRGLPSRRPTTPVEEVRPAGYSRGRTAASGLRESCPSENPSQSADESRRIVHLPSPIVEASAQ